MSDHDRGLAALLKDLESPLEDVRLAAMQALGALPSLAALRAMRHVATADSSPTLRMEARRALAAYSERIFRDLPGTPDAHTITLDRLRAMLSDPEPGVRAKLVRHLATLLDPEVPRLLEGLLDSEVDAFVLCSLLQSLAATEGPRAEPRLERYLTHADPRVRATAVESLVASGTRALSGRLIPLLQDPHDRVRVAAARALHAQERESVLASLDEMLASRQDLTLRSALYLLRFWEDEISLPRLGEALAALPRGDAQAMALASLTVRAGHGSEAAQALLAESESRGTSREVGFDKLSPSGYGAGPQTLDSEALPSSPVDEPLESRLAAEAPQTRIVAIRDSVRLGRADLLARLLDALGTETHPGCLATLVSAVGRLGTAADAAALARFLTHQEPRLRANAVEAIARLDPAAAAALISGALGDSNNRVRANAILALARAPGQDVTGELRAMAQSPHVRFRVSAVYVAAELATPATVALLAELLADVDPDVSRRARAALETLATVLTDAATVLAAHGDSRPREAAAPLSEETLQRLLFNLEHESAETRLATLKVIASMQDERLLAGLIPLLRDRDSTVRQAAMEATRRLLAVITPARDDAEALAVFEESLGAPLERAQDALAAVPSIAARAGARPVARLLAARLPSEERPAVRASALTALGLVSGPEEALVLRAMLRDTDSRVRANAVGAIELAGTEPDLVAASVCLADPDPRVRAAAIRVCMRLSKEEFLSHLRAMITAPSLPERAAALHVLRTLRFGKRLELLLAYFKHETDPRLYRDAAAALAAEPGEAHHRNLLELSEKLEDHSKAECLQQALGLDRKEPDAPTAPETPPISTGLPDAPSGTFAGILRLKEEGRLDAETIRRQLASTRDSLTLVTLLKAAAEARLPDALALTEPFTHSRDRRVRLAATGVLGRLDDPPARVLLRELAKDRDPEVSLRAVHSLRMMAPESAFQAVCSLLEMPHVWAVGRGLELLEKIGDPAALPFVLQLLSRATHPSYVEPATAIVLASGSPETLRELAAIYRRVPPNARLFVAELGFALGRHLGESERHVAALFPPAPAEPAPAPHPHAPPPGYVRLSHRALAAGSTLYATILFCTVMMLFPDGEPPPGASPTPPPRGGTRRPAVEASTVRFYPSVVRTVAVTTSRDAGFETVLRQSLADNRTATYEELERQVERELTGLKVKSPQLVRTLALDRAERAWQADLEGASEAMARRDHRAAVSLLTSTLATLDPDHLTARLEVLRQLELCTRLAGYPEQARQWASWQSAAEKKLLDLVVDAARQSGAPVEQLQTTLKAFADRQTQRDPGRKVAELFSPRR